jgi:hypothetical protein
LYVFYFEYYFEYCFEHYFEYYFADFECYSEDFFGHFGHFGCFELEAGYDSKLDSELDFGLVAEFDSEFEVDFEFLDFSSVDASAADVARPPKPLWDQNQLDSRIARFPT